MSASLELPTIDPQKPAPAKSSVGSRFHISLNVKNLDRSVEFFRVFLGREAAKCRPDYAKFELDDPPLVLSLEPFAAPPGGNLNHLGFRLPDSAALVEVQRRLELAGISTRREEGVECCYARQTKFWVHDPDGNLWEIYTLDEDLEHRGAGQVPSAVPPPAAENAGPTPAVWNHRLGQPLPRRLPILDGTVDVVSLQGTFNERRSPEDTAALLGEVLRVLKPGGTLQMHLLTADRPLGDGPLSLPGPAAAVQTIPVDSELLTLLRESGFANPHLTFRATNPCFLHSDAELRETRLEADRPQ